MSQPRYQVISRIDAGGMAEVFKANSSSMQGFQKLVAIKRVLPSLTRNERFVRMFLDEAKVSLYLNHTNCVQVFDLGIADGTYFIVMEFIDGTNLKNIMEDIAARGASFPIEHACFITIEICKGLSHAHNKIDQQGQRLHIVHRDISPPNVLVSREGEVKITDFGLAKAASQVETTDPGVVKGKFGYLSPEAANGHPVDARTDIFAVGILLWEMLVGKRLFLGRTDLETLKQVQSGRFRPVTDYRSDVPHQLNEIIERALATDPARRYQDTHSLAQDLARFMYSYGRSVTSYDVATHVQAVLSERQAVSAPQDSGINEAIQREINKLVSLEEVDDLDLYLANTYSSVSSQDSDVDIEHFGSLEDPSEWFDEEEGAHPDFAAPTEGGGGDGWQAAEIGTIRQTTSGSMPALDAEAVQQQQPLADPTKPISRDDIDRMQREQANHYGQRGHHAPQQQHTPQQQHAPQQHAPHQHAPREHAPASHTHAARPQEPSSMSAEARAHQQQALAAPPVGGVQAGGGGGNNVLNIALIIAVLGFVAAIVVMGYFIVAG
jgi:serine/threonine-protein kinase